MGWTKQSYDALFRYVEIGKREAAKRALLADGLVDEVKTLEAAPNMGVWYRMTTIAAETVGKRIVAQSAKEAEAELKKIAANYPQTLPQLICHRCGHRWVPRTDKVPAVCPNPKCKSRYWDKPRRAK
jgi:rubrerythrin